MKYTLIVTLLLGLFSFTLKETPRAILKVKVEGINKVEGNLGILVFDKEQGFPESSKQAILELEVKVTSKEMEINLESLPYGNYAIALVHDINANNILDKNILGIPKEPFGFSNVNKVFFGPPSFKDASILLNEGHVETKIRLQEL